MEELRRYLQLAREVVSIYESELTYHEKVTIVYNSHYDWLKPLLPIAPSEQAKDLTDFYDFAKSFITRLQTVKGLRQA